MAILAGCLYILIVLARRAFGTTRVTAVPGTLALFAILAWEWAFLLKVSSELGPGEPRGAPGCGVQG